jgi:hypothetical protein
MAYQKSFTDRHAENEARQFGNEQKELAKIRAENAVGSEIFHVPKVDELKNVYMMT